MLQVVEEIARCISQDGSNDKETCQFLNVGLSFLFQELKDSLAVKRSVRVDVILVNLVLVKVCHEKNSERV